MTALDDLNAAVGSTVTVEGQAVAFIANLSSQLAAAVAAANTDAVEALATQLQTATQALNAVVNPAPAANT